MRRTLPTITTRGLLVLAVTAAIVLTAFAVFFSSSPSLPTHIRDPSVGKAAIDIDIADATLSADAAGCGLCRDAVSCDHAFKGTPGQFCHALLSGVPCCCPLGSECVESTGSSCRCHRPKTAWDKFEDGATWVLVGCYISCWVVFACYRGFRVCCYGEPFCLPSSGKPSTSSSINSPGHWRDRGYDTTTTTTTTTFGGGDFAGDAGDGGDGGDFGGDA